jgi:undecaprenyl diphosphate synthase
MHVAIIMDGNGRWATQRGLPRSAGHRAGAKTVDVVVQAAARAKIGTLTLYAFSAANWARPRPEVAALFALLRRYLATQTPRCVQQSIRIEIIGRRDRLSPQLLETIEHSERTTAHCDGMRLRIAVDYSAQQSILETCRRMVLEGRMDRSRFIETLVRSTIHLWRPPMWTS